MSTLSNIWKFKLPIILVAIITFAVCAGPILPLTAQMFLYSASETFNDLLTFALPFIIFSLIFSSVINLKQGAIRLIILLLPLICISNFIALWIAYGSGLFIVKHTSFSLIDSLNVPKLGLLWKFTIPQMITTKHSMLLAACIGILSSKYFPTQGKKLSDQLSKITTFILAKVFIPCLPIMILGVIIKMQYSNMLHKLLHNYVFVICAIIMVQATYILSAYLITNKFKASVWINNLINMIPSFITGFSTMSGVAAMPLVLNATKKNIDDSDVINFVVPTSINFHFIGGCLALPIISLAVMASFGYALPDMQCYLMFSVYYMLTRFSVTAVPGGGMMILMALLESHFRFSNDMLSLVQMLNVMLEPIIAAMNVLANGIFAIIFVKVYRLFKNTKSALAT